MTTQSNGRSLMVQGRILWTMGNLFTGKEKVDDRTKQKVIDQRTGSPVVEYGFGLAVPKVDPRTNQHTQMYIDAYQALMGEALTLYPGGQLPPGFAMKFKDGDTDVDHKGVPYSAREGYPGHIVIACTTQIPIKYFRFEGNQNILVNDGIKCGDYVNVQLNIKAHPAVGQGKPGLYTNPTACQLIQPGKEIINTPSGDQVFGLQAPTYVGTVEAPTTAPMPNYAQPPMGAPAPMPQQQQYAQPAPVTAPAPHYGVIPPTHQPQVGNAPMPGAPVGNGQIPYTQPPMGAPSAPSAYPSNPGLPPMPGMPR